MWSWTDVKDCLPKENGRYIVVSKTNQKPFMANFALNLSQVDPNRWQTHRPGFWNTDDVAIFSYPDILYWMPMPDLPSKR